VITALRAAGAPAPGPDRWLAPEIETAVQLVASGGVVAAAESVTGPLE
jgi:histidine ammonia-lyase